jgi:hypothetical protein
LRGQREGSKNISEFAGFRLPIYTHTWFKSSIVNIVNRKSQMKNGRPAGRPVWCDRR